MKLHLTRMILLTYVAVSISLLGCGKSRDEIAKEDADRQARASAAAEADEAAFRRKLAAGPSAPELTGQSGSASVRNSVAEETSAAPLIPPPVTPGQTRSSQSRPALWPSTAYGMSVEEVKAAVQGVIEPSRPNHLASGAIELLRLPEIELVQHKFEGAFFFLDRKLTQVSFSLNEPATGATAESVFEALSVALRGKYGGESARKNIPGMISSEWASDSINISLLLFAIDGRQEKKPLLTLMYQRQREQANKL